MSSEEMRVFDDINSLPTFCNPVVTVGSYDGVHRGHSFLLEIMRERAALSKGETIVVTFAQHPRKVLRHQDSLSLLSSPKEKALLLEREGVDNLVVIPFNTELSRISPEDFLRDFLIGKLHARELVVGYNHHFGKDKQGNAETLRSLQDKYGFRIYEAGKFADGTEKISSTTVRDVIARGDMEHAARLLGHRYILLAEVEKDGTVILEEPLKLLPPAGEYPVSANGTNTVMTISDECKASIATAPQGEVLISF